MIELNLGYLPTDMRCANGGWNKGFDHLSPEVREQVTNLNKGKVISAETRAKMSASNKGIDRLAMIDRVTINSQKKTVVTPFGTFRSAGEASKILNIKYQTLVSRVKNFKNPAYKEWYYA
tara:strand:- start:324 stop:683 length:360 start_codon:yes stop_codon:yes gene_type:complete